MKMKAFTKLLLLLITVALIFTLAACKKDDTTPTPEPTPDPTPSGCTEHVYDNGCDTTCNTCGEVREAQHLWEHGCDPECNLCGETRETAHRYDNDCDRNCNLCGSRRDITHTYDNACDADCNVCGNTRTPDEHEYDNGCDKTCNICFSERETEHVYDNGCDRVCNECGKSRAESEHVYTNECDTACDECGHERKDPPHLDEGVDGTCDLCGKVLFINTPADKFDLPEIPLYDGKSVSVSINGGKPFFLPSQITTESYEYYSALDALGRCGVAVGCLGPETLPTDSRGDIASISPSGWHSAPPIYARCHLIAWMISGENANRQNLVTGTILLNSTMIPFENLVCDYIKETGNHVMYRATPVFMGDNLVASGIILEAYSVEDEGYGIEFCVYIHNVQTDYIIDYATGDATLTEDGKLNNCDFVVGKSNYKIHLPSCRSASSIKEENRLYMNGTYQEVYDYLVSLGKSPSPCGTCKPQNSARQIYCIIPDKRLAPVITKTRRAA